MITSLGKNYDNYDTPINLYTREIERLKAECLVEREDILRGLPDQLGLVGGPEALVRTLSEVVSPEMKPKILALFESTGGAVRRGRTGALSEETRTQIITALKAGKKAGEIAAQLKVRPNTVHKVKSRLGKGRAGGSPAPGSGSGS